MKLEDQVCSLELAKRLKEFGVKRKKRNVPDAKLTNSWWTQKGRKGKRTTLSVSVADLRRLMREIERHVGAGGGEVSRRKNVFNPENEARAEGFDTGWNAAIEEAARVADRATPLDDSGEAIRALKRPTAKGEK